MQCQLRLCASQIRTQKFTYRIFETPICWQKSVKMLSSILFRWARSFEIRFSRSSIEAWSAAIFGWKKMKKWRFSRKCSVRRISLRNFRVSLWNRLNLSQWEFVVSCRPCLYQFLNISIDFLIVEVELWTWNRWLVKRKINVEQISKTNRALINSASRRFFFCCSLYSSKSFSLRERSASMCFSSQRFARALSSL